MKVAIIGTRHVHAPGFSQLAQQLGHEIVGAFEPDASAHAAWNAHGIAPLVELDELLAQADAAFICGTNLERTDHALAAIDAGLPVLVEKPVAMSEDDIVRWSSVSPDARVMAMLPLRFAPILVRAKESIEAGAIGRPLAARCTNHGTFPGGWFGDRALAGGGALMDHTVHLSDGLCWLLGTSITSVFARAQQSLHVDIDVDDCAVVHANFASGFFATIDASWSRPKSFHTWGDVWLEIIGEDGRLVLDPLARSLTVYDDSLGRMRSLGVGEDMSAGMLEAFFAYAANGGTSPVSLAEAMHASEVVLAAYRSVASDRVEAVNVGAPALSGR